MLALTLLSLTIGFLILIAYLLIITKDQPEILSYGMFWYELNYPEGTGRFEIVVTFEHSSFIDINIPCLKTTFYKDGQSFFEFIFSFGIPIDSELINISETTSINSENQLQNLNEESLGDTLEFTSDFAYNLGRIYALVIAIIVTALIATTFGWTPLIMAFTGIITVILWFFFKIFTNPSSEIRKALIAGYGYGLFDVGTFMFSPICPGGIQEDLSIWLPLFTGLSRHFKNVFLPEYEDELATEIAFISFSILSTFLWNYGIEEHLDRVSGWIVFFTTCYGIGLFLCFSIDYFPWIWGIQ